MSKLFRSSLITSVATFMSRILGLIRDVFIAGILGAGQSSDVFFFAQRIPNFLRRLFAEGAFSQAFVPVMAEFKAKKDKEGLNDLISHTSGTLGALVFLITILGMLGSHVVTAIFGWGWFEEWLHDGPEGGKFVQASFLLKITTPYLFFITLTAVSGAILNTFEKFLIPAITPCLMNLCMIASCICIAPYTEDPNFALSLGFLAGGVVQFAFQLPFLYRLGCLVKPKISWNHPGVAKIRKLMLPAIFSVSVSQINLIINTIIATNLATGAISYLYYSDRLLEFPIGIFGVAIGTVILPALSRQFAKKDNDGYVKTMDWGIRLVLLLGFPAMMGIIMLREPIVRVLYMRGEFGLDAAGHVGLSVIASVSGLWAIMLVRVLAPGFNARQDTATPVRYGIISMITNICCSLIIVFPLEKYLEIDGGLGYGYLGLALATTVSAVLNATLLLCGLARKNIYHVSRSTVLFIIKLLAGTAIMSVGLSFIREYFAENIEAWASLGLLVSIVYLSVLIVAGALIYFVSLFALGIRPSHLRGV